MLTISACSFQEALQAQLAKEAEEEAETLGFYYIIFFSTLLLPQDFSFWGIAVARRVLRKGQGPVVQRNFVTILALDYLGVKTNAKLVTTFLLNNWAQVVSPKIKAMVTLSVLPRPGTCPLFYTNYGHHTEVW
jgi:hypothetical protein